MPHRARYIGGRCGTLTSNKQVEALLSDGVRVKRKRRDTGLAEQTRARNCLHGELLAYRGVRHSCLPQAISKLHVEKSIAERCGDHLFVYVVFMQQGKVRETPVISIHCSQVLLPCGLCIQPCHPFNRYIRDK